jgi:hypothetical protein
MPLPATVVAVLPPRAHRAFIGAAQRAVERVHRLDRVLEQLLQGLLTCLDLPDSPVWTCPPGLTGWATVGCAA